jgi:hypothetical protein
MISKLIVSASYPPSPPSKYLEGSGRLSPSGCQRGRGGGRGRILDTQGLAGELPAFARVSQDVQLAGWLQLARTVDCKHPRRTLSHVTLRR